MDKIGILIQARMASTRLPGKVLMKLGNQIVLEKIVNRLAALHNIDLIAVATSNNASDDQIKQWCDLNNVLCFRGSEDDVLDRYYQAIEFYDLDAVIRITGDCPLIDPTIVSILSDIFRLGTYDEVCLAGDFPDGLDCQVFSREAIKIAWENATASSDREHVGSYIENTNPDRFNILPVPIFQGLGHHRWTLDEQSDFEFLSSLIASLDNEGLSHTTRNIIDHLIKNPNLLQINSHIVRNSGYIKSLTEDQSQ